jgi:hypothetical protein
LKSNKNKMKKVAVASKSMILKRKPKATSRAVAVTVLFSGVMLAGGVPGVQALDCRVGDVRYAHFPGDDASALRKVSLKRQHDSTCEFWVSWHHEPDLCTGNENTFWGDARSDKRNYCSYPPKEIFESKSRDTSAHCADDCGGNGSGDGSGGSAGADEALGDQTQFIMTYLLLAAFVGLMFCIVYIMTLAVREGVAGPDKGKTYLGDDLESSYSSDGNKSYVTHGGMVVDGRELRIPTGLTPKNSKNGGYSGRRAFSPSWSPTNGAQGG